MSSRDEVVRLALLAFSFRKKMAGIPCTTLDDARRWVRFAHRCVSNVEDLPNELRQARELAERWENGDGVSGVELRQALQWARNKAGTLSSRLRGPTAAQWAVISALEAACIADTAREHQEVLPEVVRAAENAARFARLVPPEHAAAKVVEYQQALLSEIFSPQLISGDSESWR